MNTRAAPGRYQRINISSSDTEADSAEVQYDTQVLISSGRRQRLGRRRLMATIFDAGMHSSITLINGSSIFFKSLKESLVYEKSQDGFMSAACANIQLEEAHAE